MNQLAPAPDAWVRFFHGMKHDMLMLNLELNGLITAEERAGVPASLLLELNNHKLQEFTGFFHSKWAGQIVKRWPWSISRAYRQTEKYFDATRWLEHIARSWHEPRLEEASNKLLIQAMREAPRPPLKAIERLQGHMRYTMMVLYCSLDVVDDFASEVWRIKERYNGSELALDIPELEELEAEYVKWWPRYERLLRTGEL
jgi:hypothetical protein